MILGLDPSFRGFGVARIDTQKKRIDFSLLLGPSGYRDWDDVFKLSGKVIEDFLTAHKSDLKGARIAQEIPPPNSIYSAGLWGLSYYLTSVLNRYELESYHAFRPNYLGHILRARSHRDSEVAKYGVQLIRLFEQNGFQINERLVRGSINHNKAAALIFATRIFYKYYYYHDRTLFKELDKLNFGSEKELKVPRRVPKGR